jgi:hypothetical protein
MYETMTPEDRDDRRTDVVDDDRDLPRTGTDRH